jgi:hypothetical protein
LVGIPAALDYYTNVNKVVRLSAGVVYFLSQHIPLSGGRSDSLNVFFVYFIVYSIVLDNGR